jgi:hypothetical protein
MDKTLAFVSREQILRRIRSEYLEMPGLSLTRAQARRLWAMDEQTCGEVLDWLTAARFLHRRDDGAYARITEGAEPFPQLRMAKVERTGAPESPARSAAPSRR